MGGDLIQTPQTLWKQGAYESVQRGSAKMLFTNQTSVGGGDRYSTFQNAFTTAGYAVPAGKTLYITELLLYSNIIATAISLFYSDDDVGISSAVAPTNLVRAEGSGGNPRMILPATETNALYRTNVLLPIPSGKYVGMIVMTSSALVEMALIGHEE